MNHLVALGGQVAAARTESVEAFAFPPVSPVLRVLRFVAMSHTVGPFKRMGLCTATRYSGLSCDAGSTTTTTTNQIDVTGPLAHGSGVENAVDGFVGSLCRYSLPQWHGTDVIVGGGGSGAGGAGGGQGGGSPALGWNHVGEHKCHA